MISPPATALLDVVAEDIKRVEDRMRADSGNQYSDIRAVVEYLVSAGGKRIRPALTMMAASFYPVDKDKAYSLAAAVELLHTATLVHDDLIDNSLFRRGMPTLNAGWSPGATILTGDYLFARSAELAAQTENTRVVTIFSQTLMTIVGGELHQMFNNGHGELPSLEEYHQRIYAKTASLFAAGMETGAVLCGAPENEIQALRAYGHYLGMAFQIVDDILDFQGSEDRLGKPVANDLRQGIATLPVLLFAKKQPNHPVILKAIRHEPLKNEEILAVVQEIRRSGSIEAAMVEARQFARQAQATLGTLPNNRYRQAMYGLADYTVDRDI